MEYRTTKKDNGEPGFTFPMSIFTLNPDQQAMVLGVDFEAVGGMKMEDAPGFESMHIGKLSEQGFVFNCQLGNSLVKDGFPLDQHPDPEIIITSRINPKS